MRHQALFLLFLCLFKFNGIAQNNSMDQLINLKTLDSTFVYDMKYATDDNFLKAVVYDCAECYLRENAVKALVQAQADFIKKGYRIKIYDCYRPLDIQKRMWKIVSDPKYVADPSKGSLHNRGLAVDLTLVDSLGNELDMGTKFDHFGPEAAVNYSNLSKEIKKNRKLLQKVMKRHGFNVLPSEWWHFNFQQSIKPDVANYVWPCP